MCQIFGCCAAPADDGLLKERGFDRGPTAAEIDAPPDKRPWTEYDAKGIKQPYPPYKACPIHLGCCCGPAIMVFEVRRRARVLVWRAAPSADQG